MSKEALKLALEALEDIGDEWGFTSQRTVPKRKEAITAIKEALANEALDKMAENARKLGLDYEPAQRTWVGLTDEEVKKIVGLDRYTDLLKEVVQYVEAKLRSKNS
jgi:signal recognition particle subunit SEC65